MIVISNRFCAELPSNLNQSLLLLSSRGIGCPKYYILLVLFTLVNTASFSGSYSLHRQPYAAECTGSNFLSVLIFGVYQSWTGVIGFFYHISVSVSHTATIPFCTDATWTPLYIWKQHLFCNFLVSNLSWTFDLHL